MQKYTVEVRETRSRLVEVEAVNRDDALASVMAKYYRQTIVLTDDDFDGDTEFFIQGE